MLTNNKDLEIYYGYNCYNAQTQLPQRSRDPETAVSAQHNWRNIWRREERGNRRNVRHSKGEEGTEKNESVALGF